MGIFLIHQDGHLIEMSEQGYDAEVILQDLIEQYPRLLVANEIDSSEPKRWLLIAREMGVDSDERSVGQVDHLFLDQDAVPTLVEVKRSSDTRIRREVVGQMLDYAANAVLHWPIEMIRARFETYCQAKNQDPDEELISFLGPEADAELFWTTAHDNLQMGRIRMLFVADKIPSELRRIVEFLNEQMNPAEVLAVEIRQYVGEGQKSLVPRLIGQTTEAEGKKRQGRRPERQWDEETLFAELESKCTEAEALTARRILEWAQPKTTRIYWGKGRNKGSFVPVLNHKGTDHQVFVVSTNGRVEIYFTVYRNKPPFESEELRKELLRRLNEISNVALPADSIDRLPTIPLRTLADGNALEQFFDVFGWFIETVMAS